MHPGLIAATWAAQRSGLYLLPIGLRLTTTKGAFHPGIPITDSGKLHRARLRTEWQESLLALYETRELSGEMSCATH